MGARLVIFNDIEPEIGINLEYVPVGGPVARGWHGACTQCGERVHYWNDDRARRGAQAHVNAHRPGE